METPVPPPLIPHPRPSAAAKTTMSVTAAATTATATPTRQLQQLHAQLLKSSAVLSSHFLFKLFSHPSSLHYALSVFRHIPDPSTGICNRFLKEFSRSSDPRAALLAYQRMRYAGVPMDRFSFPPLLKAAAKVSGWEQRTEVHGLAAKLGFDSDPFIQTGLVGAYAAGGRVDNARKVFDHMFYRDIVAWGVMFNGYCQCDRYNDALLLFEEMKDSTVVPDPVVLVSVISACGRTGNLNYGKMVHSYIADNHIEVDDQLQTALINMYSSCGDMDAAKELFDMCPENMVASTAMVFGYAKAGNIDVARSIFDQMFEKDLVAWSAMIAGYVESDRPTEALMLFKEMQGFGIRPDQVTLLSVISACASLGALDQAKWIHLFADRNGFEGIMSINNALIDMYSKCGCLASARRVFEAMPKRNVISWTSMINGLAMHGDCGSALRLFDQMKAEGIEPNGVTFVGLLYACAHAGLVEEGRQVFTSMVNEHRIDPQLEHYGCMVDILGRAKLLNDAVELIKKMPFRPNVVVWGSLLGACRIHGYPELGEYAAKRILELDPGHDGAYVLLSNIFAKANRWEDVGELRRFMKSKGVLKERGCSWIELSGQVHEFVMGDESHPKSKEIYAKLGEVVREVERKGYAPNSNSVLVDLEEEEKREAILLHSEKLALSFRLIDARRGTCIRIAKNLRVCEDCHTFMKLVSMVFETEIVLRDRTRFHNFTDGVCSCKDFW